MSEQTPVPVDAARRVADDYAKDLVVITSWDRASNVVFTATYGRTAPDKHAAARLGVILAEAAGCDMSQVTPYEDFRTATAAEWAEEKDKLLRRIRELEGERNA